MHKLLRQSFRMSIHKSILVNDPAPFDILANDIPPGGLHQTVSAKLEIPYLSKYNGTKEDLTRKMEYNGVLIGDHSRLFFSIPTASLKSSNYYYIHYLLDTGSPYTTLTHQALCCIYQKQQNDPNVYFPSGKDMNVGGTIIQVHLSNPNPNRKNLTQNYHNVNLLGQNFLRYYRISKLQQNFKTNQAKLELIE